VGKVGAEQSDSGEKCLCSRTHFEVKGGMVTDQEAIRIGSTRTRRLMPLGPTEGGTVGAVRAFGVYW